MKSGNTSINIEAFKDHTKEEFLKATKGINIDHESVWKAIVKLNCKYDTNSSAPTGSKHKKSGKSGSSDESTVSGLGVSGTDTAPKHD